MSAQNLSAAGATFYLRESVSKKLFALARPLESIGRLGTSMSFPEDKKLSRLHCRIFRDAQGLAVCDMGSRNRTYVNDEPLAPRVRRPLRVGDVLRVGAQRFEIVARAPKPASAASAIPGRALELSVPAKPRSELGLKPGILDRARVGFVSRVEEAEASELPWRENSLLFAWIAAFATLALARKGFSFAEFAAGASIPRFVFVEIFVPTLLLGLAVRSDLRSRLLLSAAVGLAWVFLFR